MEFFADTDRIEGDRVVFVLRGEHHTFTLPERLVPGIREGDVVRFSVEPLSAAPDDE